MKLSTIAELRRRIGSEFDDELTLSSDEARALLDAAERLAKLESALSHLCEIDGLITVPDADSDDTFSFCPEAESVLTHAAGLGWKEPSE